MLGSTFAFIPPAFTFLPFVHTYGLSGSNRNIFRKQRTLSTHTLIVQLGKYPALYAISEGKNASVAEMWNPNLASWILHGRRNLKEIEIDEWASLINSLDQITLSKATDNWCWKLEKNGDFSSNSLLKSLSAGHLFDCSNANTPQKSKFFIWEISQSCMNTTDKLQSRSPWITLSLQITWKP